VLVSQAASTPSGQRPPYEKENKRKVKKRKKPGRKKGHPGSSRKPPDKIDHYQDHRLEQCPHCQETVGPGVKSHTRYIEDIPTIEPEVTEHTVFDHWCPSCQEYVTPAVTEAMDNANLGIRLVVLAAWLHYAIGISVRNVVKILSVVCSFPVTPGGLTQAWVRLANLLRPEYEAILEQIRNSAALHADETGWRLDGITFWLWAFCTKEYCYYTISKCRGSPVVEQALGILFKGILICDFWGAYNKLKALAKQRCYYHLFTELVKVDQRNTSQEWAAFRKKLKKLLKDALRLRDKKDNLDAKAYDRRKKRLHKRLEMLIETVSKDQDVQRLIKRLKRHEKEIFTFLDYDVSPYNNHAEQQIRPPVISRRISQQNRSQAGAEAQAILMSLFQTAKLQGLNPVEHVTEQGRKAIERKHIQKNEHNEMKMAA
jgi:transposase